MRHGKKVNHLSRKSAHRKSMLANMACSLVEHKRIRTTLAKAKALRVFVEPIITKAKEDTTHSRRMAFRSFRSKEAVKTLFGEVAGKVADRPGGYTRIIRLGNRLGDNAQVALIELVDYNDVYTNDKAKSTTKKKRTRRAGKSTDKSTSKDETTNEAVEEKPVDTPKAEVEKDTPKAEEKKQDDKDEKEK